MTMARESKSILFGIVAAGFGPFIGFNLLSAIEGRFGDISSYWLMSLVLYPLALIFACVFGLPLFFLARRLNLVRWWLAIAAGMFVGIIVQFLVLNGTHNSDNLFLYAVEGMTSALLFFLVWKRHERTSA